MSSVEDIPYEAPPSKAGQEIDGLNTTVTVTAIEFDWLLKEQEGEDFLQQLSDTDDLSFFEIDIVKFIIKFQWKRYLPRIALYLFLPFLIFFIAFLIFATWIINEMHQNDYEGPYRQAAVIYAILLGCYQIFFLSVEINQIMRNTNGYFTSFWNVVDVISILINYVLILMVCFKSDPKSENAVAGVAVLLMWFRVFYLLRVFTQTAYLVGMITAIIVDMRYFVVALLLAILAFGNSYYILGRNSEEDNFTGDNIWEAFIFAFRTGFGDFNTDDFGTPDEVLIWIIFFINTIIIVIILLNLVIAIMGNTFERVQETQESTKLREFANIIRDNEFLISRKRLFGDIKYIIVVSPNKSADEQEGDWQGKLQELKKKLKLQISKNQDKFTDFQKRLSGMLANGLKEKLKPTEDKINQTVETFETRLTKVMEKSEMNRNASLLETIKRVNRGFLQL